MKVELLVIPDCPNGAAAAVLLREVLDRVGLAGAGFGTVVVDNPVLAEARGFAGSPSFHVDGVDVFPVAGGSAGMACRVYRTPSGALSGLPDPAALSAALARAVGDQNR
ncbi:MAG TPA: hypothetical protein VFJ97_02500 [Dermatophilaceae bacterium]|nr:hypothetical protein [Dermatophilaceae bacterium]